MRKRLPPLDSLRVLSACVRHGNFSRAAAELGITPAAVSQRVRALEAGLGVRLFKRHGPRLTATARAQALGQRIEQALSLMHAAVDDCRRSRPPLRVTCAPTFAARWLLPRLTLYHAIPGADAIVLDNSQAESPPGSFDVAIRSGRGPWPGYRGIKLMAEERTPMLARKWAAQALSVRGLQRVPLIPDADWIRWFRLAGLSSPKFKLLATRFANYELEAQAAVQGAGAALLSPLLFGDLLAQGALVAPFPQRLDSGVGYWLLWQDAERTHFVRWIKSQFGIDGGS